MNYFTQAILSFSQAKLIIPLLIIGYIWLDRKIFFSATCLVLTNMLFAFALKITFKVPLLPSVGHEGFAFPSTHMQSAVVLYGWILLNSHNKLYKILLISLLYTIGSSLIYCGYHTFTDVLGAIFFGSLLLIAFIFLPQKHKSLITLFTSTLLMLYIGFKHKLIEHLWLAYYSLIGILLSNKIFANKLSKQNLKQKFFTTISCLLTIIIFKILFKHTSSLPIFIQQANWLITGFCLPFFQYMFNNKNDTKQLDLQSQN